MITEDVQQEITEPVAPVKPIGEQIADGVRLARSKYPALASVRGINISRDEAMRRWPRLTAHMICHSLGYACPQVAANIILDARAGKQNWCEWIASCYKCDPKPALQRAISGRHHHRGYMAEYTQAITIVLRKLIHNEEPNFGFASWF